MSSGEVRGSAEAIGALAAQLGRAVEACQELSGRLRAGASALEGGGWTDAHGQRVVERLRALRALTDQASGALQEIAADAERAAARYQVQPPDAAALTPAIIAGSRPRGAPKRAPSSAGRPAVIGVVPGRTGELELWDFAGVDPEAFDWGGDPGFPQRFPGEVHHGNSAEVYRAWARAAGAVAARINAGEVPPPGSFEAQVRDVFLGSEPVRVCASAVPMQIDAGRHRVLAAILEGAVIPVQSVER